ncbi:unnamed protein product [Phytomonas sp. Hart1]|nr:unnamed protein product [Phytomonas sp. Hart1]|eukprot:CCW66264.1 unnamed protein product [Phytomonas sp. isolate Hart1]
MDDKQFNIRRLQSLFPQLSTAQACDILERHNWNLESTLKEAESSTVKVSNLCTNTENNPVRGSEHGSAQQKDTSHTNATIPGGRGDIEKVLEGLFTQASQGGIDKNSGIEPQNAFYGRGRRLGHTEHPSPYIASTLRQQRDVSITLYRNGISMDNGMFIAMDSPEGKEFLETMHQGYIPSSLASQYPDCELNVTLLDRLELDYKPVSYTAFKGEGHCLRAKEGASSTAGGEFRFDASRSFHFEPSEDTSFICMLNTQGERREFKVNPFRHTVEDVYHLAHGLQPDLERFSLVVRSIPPYNLENSMRSQTIQEAKLSRAVITIRPF